MSFGPNLSLWTRGKGAKGKWTLRHTTASFDDAVVWFEQLDAEGQHVAIYELGRFEHEGKEITGQVGFWWNAGLNDYMTREPIGRGHGWTEDFDTWVEYTFPETEAKPASSDGPWGAPAVMAPQVANELTVADEPDEPEERYVEAACDHCGRILPMNHLQRLTHDVETGHTSGSRSTRARSSRQSTRFAQGRVTITNSSGSGGSSSSSSRTYYRTETLLLCEACFVKQKQADHPILTFLTRLLD